MPEQMRELGRHMHTELIDVLHADAGSSSMLFVVDNVPEPAPGTAPLPLETWCPGLGKVTCLATSRKRLEGLGSIETIDLDVLETLPACALLTDRVGEVAQLKPTEWARIADWVGCLPLALTLLNAALRRSGRRRPRNC